MGDVGGRLRSREPELEDAQAREAPRRGGQTRALLERLEQLAEAQIIPRLARADAGPRPRAEGAVLAEEIGRLCHLVLGPDEAPAAEMVTALRARGLSAERVYFDLLAPVARRLGDFWEDDRCDFTQVTVGVWRLERLMRELSPAFRSECEAQPRGHVILLMPTPGEQHTFGLHMIAECFRRAAWQVEEEVPAAPADAAALAARRSYDVAGFTLGSDRGVDALARSISLVRRASANRGICIMVGGAVFEAQPGLVTRVGADTLARNGAQAVQHAGMLIGSSAA